MSSMKFVYQAELISIMFISSLACGQEPTRTTSQSGPPPLEVKLTKGPLWKGACLELSVQLTNVSKSAIFLDAMYQGIEVYSSVSDPTNTLGQGAGKAWILLYGRTDVVLEDVVPERIELVSGTRRQNVLCVAETFPVKEAGKETLRQVPVQGKLRIVVTYGQKIPTWRIIDQSQGKGRRSYVRVPDNSNRWNFDDVVLEIPIPCPAGVSSSDCISPPPVFPGEHDVRTFEPERPPTIEVKPPLLPTFPNSLPPPPPKS